MGSIKHINFQIKNQIKLFIGDRSKVPFDSGCKMFDVIFLDTFQFDTLTFQNSYTAYITIKAKEKKGANDMTGEWRTILKRYKLMPNCHGENGANKSFTLTKDMMLQDTKNISQLRFVLQQPSICWKDFSIEDLKITVEDNEHTIENYLDRLSAKCDTIGNDQKFEEMPPIEDIANKLQNLWSLCFDAKKLSKDLKIERFDIDGHYDVHTLAS